ncbi:hypothetical protein FBR02_05850 [Anaerolineae bacterium CFX9]|nr:hypothetical protein [Anaerolineae bacterium CFX9]
MTARRARVVFLIMSLVITLVMGVATVSAQAGTPINVGQNLTGQVSPATPQVTFLLNSGQPQIINIQVLTITQGFQPALRVIDPSGVVLQSVGAQGAQTLLQTTASLSTGVYQIVVGSGNGATGDFLISVQGGAPILPPSPLGLGQAVSDIVNQQTPLLSYAFQSSQTDILILTVRAETPSSGPTVRLRDADTSDLVALSSSRLIGSRFRIPAGLTSYIVEVSHSGLSPLENFTICLEPENGPVQCPAASGGSQVVQPTPVVVIPTIQPTVFVPVSIPPNGPCAVASSQGATINIRSGPSTSTPVVAQLPNQQVALVIGRLPDNSWYQVNFNGVIGWISGSVVVIGGQCAAVPFITLTPTPPGFTATPTPTNTQASTSTPTPSNTPAPSPTLNFSLPPVFGSTALTSGFVPDPFTVGITGGGPANASYLGSGCAGYTTSAPSFSVNYTSGAFSLLRFYFIGGGDTTMIINSPSGSYFCNDDSFGTLNPTIDFNSPSSGRYDVWIGTFSQGGSISGTLYVTEVSGNHP